MLINRGPTALRCITGDRAAVVVLLGEHASAPINNAPTEREIKQFSRPRAARVVTLTPTLTHTLTTLSRGLFPSGYGGSLHLREEKRPDLFAKCPRCVEVRALTAWYAIRLTFGVHAQIISLFFGTAIGVCGLANV